MATINGKSLKDILLELQADFPKEAIKTRDYDGVKYIGVDDYRERLDAVVGIDHYNEKYDPVELVKAQDSYATKTRCTLEFLDDDYHVILTKESSGGSNIAFPKIETNKLDKDGKPIKEAGTVTNSLPNDFDSACQDAFKRICRKQLNMGKKQLEEAKSGALYILKLNRDCTISTTGHIFSNGTLKSDGKNYSLAIFKNSVDLFKAAYGLPKKGELVAIYGKSGNDMKGNPQIIFTKPGKLPETTASTSNETSAPPSNSKENSAKNTSTSNEQQNAESKKELQRDQPEVNVASSQNEIQKVLFKSTTVMKPVDNYPGCYVLKASNDKGEQILYFLKDYISKVENVLWEKFVNEVSKKTGIKFTVSVIQQKGKFYFKNFA